MLDLRVGEYLAEIVDRALATPTAAKASIHWRAVRVLKRSASTGMSAGLFSMRLRLVRKRGSAASAGKPIVSHSRANCWSVPTASISGMSAQSNACHGQMVCDDVPARTGIFPETR